MTDVYSRWVWASLIPELLGASSGVWKNAIRRRCSGEKVCVSEFHETFVDIIAFLEITCSKIAVEKAMAMLKSANSVEIHFPVRMSNLQCATVPGQSGALPGQFGALPGQSGIVAGKSGTVAGKSGSIAGTPGNFYDQADDDSITQQLEQVTCVWKDLAHGRGLVPENLEAPCCLRVGSIWTSKFGFRCILIENGTPWSRHITVAAYSNFQAAQTGKM